MRTSLRTTAAAAFATLLLGGLSACGDDSTDAPSTESSADSTPAAGEGTADAGEGTSEDDESDASAPAVGTSLSKAEITDILKESGAAVTTARVHMEMEMNAAGQAMKVVADGDMQAEPLAQSMTMDMGGMTMEIRMVDDIFYMKPAQMGEKWIRMRLADLGPMGVGNLTESLGDPTAMAAKAAKYLKDAKYIGEEDVDGASAKHYQMTVDAAGMLKEMQVPAAPGAEIPKSVTQDLWIDDEGRVVKMVQDMGSLSKMTMTMSDFGKKVDVKAPPASEVVDMKDAGLGGLAG